MEQPAVDTIECPIRTCDGTMTRFSTSDSPDTNGDGIARVTYRGLECPHSATIQLYPTGGFAADDLEADRQL